MASAQEELDKCPKCKQNTWRFNIYLHVTAPGRFYGNLGRKNMYRKEVLVQAALWETVTWFCVNPRCMHYTKEAPSRVWLVETPSNKDREQLRAWLNDSLARPMEETLRRWEKMGLAAETQHGWGITSAGRAAAHKA